MVTKKSNKRIEPPSFSKGARSTDELKALNFKVPRSFHREFKTYAARHELDMVELLHRSFDAYREKHGS